MEDDIFIDTILRRTVNLRPDQMRANFEDYLVDELKKMVEGKCVREGYVKKGSLKTPILKRSVGKIENVSAQPLFDVEFEVQICNPPPGTLLRTKVEKINALGVLAHKGPLLLIAARKLHKSQNIFEGLSIGDEIEVMVRKKKDIPNETEIHVICNITQVLSRKKKSVNMEKKEVKSDSDLEDDF